MENQGFEQNESDNYYQEASDAISLNSQSPSNLQYGKWELTHLRKECQNLGLEQFYFTYIQRVQRSFLSILFVLQTVINITHVIIIASVTQESAQLFPDVFCYTFPLLIVWVSLFSAFKEDFVKKYPAVPFITSCIALYSLIVADLIVPVYHAVYTFIDPPLRPMYATHLLYVIYMFLPLKDNMLALILGLGTAGSYVVVFMFVTYGLDDAVSFSDQMFIKVLSEAIFLTSLNFFGLYYRMMNEIAIRRTFLDRRDLVVGNLLLKFARNQENDLLLSILPEHTAEALEKDISNLLLKVRMEEKKNSFPNQVSIKSEWRGYAINKLYVEEHHDVSILYADVVNYTMITTQLPVRTLVETLHELFVKFDEASKEFDVLRIKFLGDCYYCVSGVPVKNKRHAKCCVDLGLRMIRDIRDVRISKNLDIDMRIGIHSGSLIAGVIGACKWQYDIWSKDVNIANKMESTGVPGKVHITSQTLELLDGEYIYEEGTLAAKEDPILKKHNIQTFLIGPHYYSDNIFYPPDDYYFSALRHGGGAKRKAVLARNTETSSIKMNFMKNSMENYRDIMRQADIEMARELDRMPIGKFNFNKLFTTKAKERRHTPDREGIHPFFLLFKKKKWEIEYLSEPDLLLKYSTLMVFLAFVVIFIIQNLNRPFSLVFWIWTIISGLLLFLILPITWFRKLWDIYAVNKIDIDQASPQPTNPFLGWLYRASMNIESNFLARHGIYLLSILILTSCSLIHLIDCQEFHKELDRTPFQLLKSIISFGVNYDIGAEIEATAFSPCTNPWSITESLILVMNVTFLFNRIHYLLKIVSAISILGFYSWIILNGLPGMFDNSASVNPEVSANIAHLLTLIFTLVVFHLIDRNAEYISKVDYSWKQQLLKKHEEAELTKETNKILVHNILPAHVAEIYINQQLTYEFYNEEYDNVAILFATITNFDMTDDEGCCANEKGVLNVLNEIICDFDEVLLAHKGPQRIEKIKVAGWTYMAACGLDPGRQDSSFSNPGVSGVKNNSIGRSSILNDNGRRSYKPMVSMAPRPMQRPSQNVVLTLTEFALKLMRTFRQFNEENFKENCPGLLRIGISHGKVMAGVVGSSKPLYDVWGNSVNMASRMDSTGVPGKIQVTQETAEVLQDNGIMCEYRGNTTVKGRGDIPTYFVCVDKDLNFVKRKPKKDLSVKLKETSFTPTFETDV